MNERFIKEISQIPYISENSIKFNYLMSIIRSILQYCSYSAVEYWYKYPQNIEDNDLELIKHLLNPSDGTLLNLLNRLIPQLRSSGWSNCASGWFQKLPVGVTIEESIDPLYKSINDWVIFRNNRLGHGVLDTRTIDESLEWLKNLALDLVFGLVDRSIINVELNHKICYTF